MRTLVIMALVFWALTASAQEVFLPETSAVGCDSTSNASALDGQSVIIPSPMGSEGYYRLDFDLGYWLPARQPITLTVYGDIPNGSNLYLSAATDEPFEELRHQSIVTQIRSTRSDGTNVRSVTIIGVSWAVPIRHIALTRCASKSSSNYGYAVEPQNGRPCKIDAVSVGQKKSIIQKWQFQYGGVIINSDIYGKKIVR